MTRMTKKVHVNIPAKLDTMIDRKCAALNIRRPDFVRMVMVAASSDKMEFVFRKKRGGKANGTPKEAA